MLEEITIGAAENGWVIVYTRVWHRANAEPIVKQGRVVAKNLDEVVLWMRQAAHQESAPRPAPATPINVLDEIGQ